MALHLANWLTSFASSRGRCLGRLCRWRASLIPPRSAMGLAEIELVSSRTAVAHILGDDSGLFGRATLGVGPTRDHVTACLCSALKHRQTVLGTGTGVLQRDQISAVEKLAEDLSKTANAKGGSLWGAIRSTVTMRLSESAAGGRGDAPEFENSLDAAFFSPFGQGPLAQACLSPSGADAHLHVGGAIPWNTVWGWLMTGRYPLAFYSAVSYRFLERGDASKLLGTARRLREQLLRESGLWWGGPGSLVADAALYSRLRRAGPAALDDGRVRDYVVIRSIFRREMICARVTSLTDFTGPAWNRFWGQKSGARGAIAAIGLRRRVRSLSVLKMKAAVESVSGGLGVASASFRANLDAKEVGLVRDYVKICGEAERRESGGCYSLVFHAKRPKNPSGGDNAVREWTAVTASLRRSRPVSELASSQFGVDIAGPERETLLSDMERLCAVTLEHSRQAKCGSTIHAGEDFYDPWQGLAHVLLAVKASVERGLRPRIGHGSILAVNPYVLRWSSYESLVWARRDAMAWLRSFIASGRMDGTLPDASGLVSFLKAEGTRLGSLDSDAKIRLRPAEAETSAFLIAQAASLKLIGQHKTVVETNPTSNVIVLGCPGYEWAPAWGFFANPKVATVLGSDNPGFLAVSVEEELTRLATAFDARRLLERNGRVDAHHRLPSDVKWPGIEKELRERTAKLAAVRLLPWAP